MSDGRKGNFKNRQNKYTVLEPNPIKRFWNKVNIPSNWIDDCWEWNAGKFRLGYGYFSVKSKGITAHRVAFKLTFGEIPDGLDVLHKCDNRSCCNPNHLILGTHKENMHDMFRKGRDNRIKVPYNDIKSIIIRIENGEKQTEIAKEYNVVQSTISHLKERVNL